MGNGNEIDRATAVTFLNQAEDAMSQSTALVNNIINSVEELSHSMHGDAGSMVTVMYREMMQAYAQFGNDICADFPALHNSIQTAINSAGDAFGVCPQYSRRDYQPGQTKEPFVAKTVGINDVSNVTTQLSKMRSDFEAVSSLMTTAVNAYQSLYSIDGSFGALKEAANSAAQRVRTLTTRLGSEIDTFISQFNSYSDGILHHSNATVQQVYQVQEAMRTVKTNLRFDIPPMGY